MWPTSELGRDGNSLIELTHADIEISDQDQARSVLRGIRPNVVINTAGFHGLDGCETEPLKGFLINGLALKYLAESCRELDATLVHVSSSYVFSGNSKRPYTEDDAVDPTTAYGISKLAGEQFVRAILPDNHVLVRSSRFYGQEGSNFVADMLKDARAGLPIRMADDWVSSPTYSQDLAESMLQVIARGGRGTFHITNAGACNQYEFALCVFELADVKAEVTPVKVADLGFTAQRQANAALDNKHLREIGLSQPRPWQEALADYLKLIGRLAA
jgi:dTDP-4-dehydrorhamnose reductase